MKTIKTLIQAGVALALALALAGCETQKVGYRAPEEPKVDVVAQLRKAQAPLFENLLVPLDKERPVITASFANIDNLGSSSTFGRVASEIMASGLTRRGYKVVEVKLRNTLFIKQQAGEFMLSRHLKYVSAEHDAQAVVLGTYGIGGDSVYVSARLVRTTDGVVLGASNFSLPLTEDVEHLLDLRRRRR